MGPKFPPIGQRTISTIGKRKFGPVRSICRDCGTGSSARFGIDSESETAERTAIVTGCSAGGQTYFDEGSDASMRIITHIFIR